MAVTRNQDCASNTSLAVTVTNNCSADVLAWLCIGKADGTQQCTTGGGAPGAVLIDDDVCESSGVYRLWATDPWDAATCRGVTP